MFLEIVLYKHLVSSKSLPADLQRYFCYEFNGFFLLSCKYRTKSVPCRPIACSYNMKRNEVAKNMQEDVLIKAIFQMFVMLNIVSVGKDSAQQQSL